MRHKVSVLYGSHFESWPQLKICHLLALGDRSLTLKWVQKWFKLVQVVLGKISQHLLSMPWSRVPSSQGDHMSKRYLHILWKLVTCGDICPRFPMKNSEAPDWPHDQQWTYACSQRRTCTDIWLPRRRSSSLTCSQCSFPGRVGPWTCRLPLETCSRQCRLWTRAGGISDRCLCRLTHGREAGLEENSFLTEHVMAVLTVVNLLIKGNLQSNTIFVYMIWNY